MNLKKFISGVSAFAIAASAFAGMTITASAAEHTAFSQDFTAVIPEGASEASTDPGDYGFTKISETTTEAVTLTKSGSTYTSNNDNAPFSVTKVENGKLTTSLGGRNASDTSKSIDGTAEYAATFTAVSGNNIVNVHFIWELGSATGDANKTFTGTYIADDNGKKVLDLSFYGQSGKVNVNGETKLTTTNLRNTTYTVDAAIDMNTKKITSLVLDNSAASATLDYNAPEAFDFADSDASAVSKIGFRSRNTTYWRNTSSIKDISIKYHRANPQSVGDVYSVGKTGLVYSVDFDDNATGTADLDFDYATATSSDNIVEVRTILGDGDSIDSSGIHWAKGVAYEQNSNYYNANDTASRRYILVTPQKSGKISGTYAATLTNTAGDASNVKCNIYAVDVTGLSDTDFFAAMTTNTSSSPAPTQLGTVGLNVPAGEQGTSSDIDLTEYPVTAGRTYAIYGGTSNNNTRYNQISYLVKALSFTKDGLTVAFDDNDEDLETSVEIFTDSARTSGIANGQLEDGVTYYYRATATGKETLEASFICDENDLNVSFTMGDAKIRIYARANINGVSTVIKEYSKDFTDTEYMYCEKYIEYGGIWYETTAQSDEWYGYKFTEPGSVYRDYTAKNYVYAGEETDLSYTQVGTAGTTAKRYSGGKASRLYPGNSSCITITGWHSTSDNTRVKLHVTGRGETTKGETYAIKYKVGENGSLVDTGKTISYTSGNTTTSTAELVLPNNAYIVIYHGQGWTSNVAFDCVAIEPVTAPSGSFVAATWEDYEAAGYTAGTASNEIKTGEDSIFGYYADFTGNGYSYTIKADLFAENATNHAEGLELGNLSGTGSVTVYVITNAALSSQSRVYCE